MAINYPTSLDTFTNPTATDLLTSPSHAQQHADINDAMEAVQTKLAIGNTVIGTYTAYTPTFNKLVVGNGTLSAFYCQVNGFVHFWGKVVWGSTTTQSAGGLTMTTPVTLDLTFSSNLNGTVGFCSYRDDSASATFRGSAVTKSDGTLLYIDVLNVSGTYASSTNMSPTVPFTWATGDAFSWNFYCKVA